MIASGVQPSDSRDHIVVKNHMSQSGTIGKFRPETQGRMVRTDRYKYCVYEHGKQRESLVDMIDDSLESKNLARMKEFRDVVAKHRRLLRTFGEQYDDELVSKLLNNNVAPRPFPSKSPR